MTLTKSPPYRNRKLLDLAHRVHECQMQIPNICIGYSVDGCEPAHANGLAYGKGTSMKAHDYYHVAACHECHKAYDSKYAPLDRKREAWSRGFERTMALYFENGWLVVK